MADVMAGKKPIDDLEEGVRSAIRFEIYQQAKKITQLGTKDERRGALAEQPELIRPHIEAEVIRLWGMKNGS